MLFGCFCFFFFPFWVLPRACGVDSVLKGIRGRGASLGGLEGCRGLQKDCIGNSPGAYGFKARGVS